MGLKAKPGELKLAWSNGDIVYAWGGDRKEDAHLLDYVLRTKVFDKSFQDELVDMILRLSSSLYW